MNTRILLCRSRTPVGSDTAFLTDDAIDLDSSQNYEIVRRRVFLDDVQLVTIHEERGAVYLIGMGAFGFAFIAVALFLVSIDFKSWPVALIPAAFGVPAFAAFLIRLAVGRNVVTVTGRRSRAVLRFGSFQKRRAREVYGQVCAAVRRAGRL